MIKIKLLESCGLGNEGSDATTDQHTADFLIRTGRADEVRGTNEGIDGATAADFGDSEKHLNALDSQDGSSADKAAGKTAGTSRQPKAAI